MKYIYLFLLSLSAFSVVIENNDLIVVHTTTYYHSNPQTINYSNDLVRQMKSILLFQKEPSSNARWYILKDRNQTEIYSIGGRFKPTIQDKDLSVSLIGGYLTNCLGRASASLMASVIDSKLTTHLSLHLKIRGIFTGHILDNRRIVPSTPYEESILDDTIDGLNLYDVLDTLNENDKKEYLIEAVKTGILNTYDVMNTINSDYSVVISIRDRSIYQTGNPSLSKKKINIIFE